MPSIFDWSSTAGSNTTVDGVNVNTGMPVGNVDNAIRSLMAIIRSSFSATLQNFLSGASALGISSGGTGATTAADARTALGIGSAATENTIPVAKGGTGATTAAAALDGIGAVGIVAMSLAANGYIKFNLPGTSDTFMIQWGSFAPAGDSYQTITFPAAFTSFSRVVVSNAAEPGNNNGQQNGPGVTDCSTTGFTTWTSANSNSTAFWIAVGI